MKPKCSKCTYYAFEKTDAQTSHGLRAFCGYGKNIEMAASNSFAERCGNYCLASRFVKKNPWLTDRDEMILKQFAKRKF